MLPSEARLRERPPKAGLEWRGITRFGQDYADTLAEWARRFEAAWGDIRAWASTSASAGSGASTSAIARPGFRTGRTDVIQLGLAKA
jgi:cyclopropane-fatty-acyl-phospholipid synthase